MYIFCHSFYSSAPIQALHGYLMINLLNFLIPIKTGFRILTPHYIENIGNTFPHKIKVSKAQAHQWRWWRDGCIKVIEDVYITDTKIFGCSTAPVRFVWDLTVVGFCGLRRQTNGRGSIRCIESRISFSLIRQLLRNKGVVCKGTRLSHRD